MLSTLAVGIIVLVSLGTVSAAHPASATQSPARPASAHSTHSGTDAALELSEARASLASDHGPQALGPTPGGTPRGLANLTSGLGVSLTYDAADGYVLGVAINVTNLSGSSSWGSIVQTWTFRAGNWTELSIASAPPNRDFESIAYDPTDGYVLLFGGFGVYAPTGYLRDTWTYSAGTWSNLSSSITPTPGARAYAPMTWDAADGYAVMVGGMGPNGNFTGNLSSTWTFVGGTWTLSGSAASLQNQGAIAYDAADGYVVYFGGAYTFSGVSNETWKFSNGSWTSLTSSVAGAPPARANPAMTYDPNYGAVLLFGGITVNAFFGWGYLNDTWTYRNLTWTLLSASSGPTPREQSQLTFDAADNVSVLFGGANYSSGQSYSDTWTFGPAGNTTNRSGGWSQAAPVLRVTLALDDVGALIQLHALGVQGSWVHYAYAGLPPGCASADTNVLDCTPIAGGNFTVVVTTTSASGTATAKTLLTVVPAPTVDSFAVSPVLVETTQTAVFQASSTGGIAPFVVTYAGLPQGCPSLNTLTLSCVPATAGTYAVTVQVVDSLGLEATGEATLNVIAHLAVTSVGATPLALDLGQSTRVAAAIDGGIAPYSFTFSGLPTGCSSVNASGFSCVPTETGTFSWTAGVSDRLGYLATGSGSLVVNPDPAVVSFTLSSASVTAGGSVTFTTVASGGTGAVDFAYAGLPAGCAGPDAAIFTCTPAETGNFTVGVTIVDAVGYTAAGSVTLEVKSAPIITPPGGSPTGNSGGGEGGASSSSSFWSLFLFGLGVGLIALAISIGALLWRARIMREGLELVRKMRAGTPPPSTSAEPDSGRPADSPGAGK